MPASRGRGQYSRDGDETGKPEQQRDGLDGDEGVLVGELLQIERREHEEGDGDEERPNGVEEEEVGLVGVALGAVDSWEELVSVSV